MKQDPLFNGSTNNTTGDEIHNGPTCLHNWILNLTVVVIFLNYVISNHCSFLRMLGHSEICKRMCQTQ